MLEVKDIHTYYGKSYVLQGVSLSVPEGLVVAVMGRNGMGKTTLIRSIMGLSPASRGQITFKGIDITHLPTYKIVRSGIALAPQGRFIFPSLTVRENLQVAAKPQSGGWDMDKVLALFPPLRERLEHRGNELSGGEQQMLASSRALVSNPSLLLLDEPSEGVAPVLVHEFTQVLQKLKDTGLSILLVEPNLSVVRKLADYVYVMSKGTIVYHSTAEQLCQDKQCQSQYLGI